jgi:hypothetical protein
MAPLDDPRGPRTGCCAWPPPPGALTTRTGTGRGQQLDAYAAERGLKDAMAAVLRTEDRVHGLLLVGGRLGDVTTFSSSDLALLETFARHVARRWSAAGWRRTCARSPTSRSSCATRRCTTR